METEIINTKPLLKIRNKSIITYLLTILTVNILFYDEYFGINALIIAVLAIILFSIKNKEKLIEINWWLSACIWLFCGLGVFITGFAIAITCYLLAFLLFVAVNSNTKLFLPTALMKGISEFGIGFHTFFQQLKFRFNQDENNKNKWVINILIISIPIIIILVFFKLYQTADQEFYELTKFINLDFISWGFILSYLLLSVSFFGFYFHSNVRDLDEIDARLENDIHLHYSDRIQIFFGLKNEHKIATLTLVALNVLLVLYNILDVKFILIDLPTGLRDSNLSEIVHSGIYALITSIVLVILLVAYFLRGQLNFRENKLIKSLVSFWLFQNLVMIFTTLCKNYEYVDSWGLTHKRIGVFIYLGLAIIGLILTFHKVYRNKTIWSLLRNTSMTFAFCLSALLTFNWNRVIAKYNTEHLPIERVDYAYLESLGPECYYFILKEHMEHQSVAAYVLNDIAENSEIFLNDLHIAKNNTTWKSMVWTNHQIESELQQFNFVR